jgi:hypothetical protein
MRQAVALEVGEEPDGFLQMRWKGGVRYNGKGCWGRCVVMQTTMEVFAVIS